MTRVARRVVLFTWDPATVSDGWVVRDYFPSAQELIPDGYRFAHTLARLGDARAEPVPVPHDCLDGFLLGLRRRWTPPPWRTESSGCVATWIPGSGPAATGISGRWTSWISAIGWWRPRPPGACPRP